jgi:hypothetical protein
MHATQAMHCDGVHRLGEAQIIGIALEARLQLVQVLPFEAAPKSKSTHFRPCSKATIVFNACAAV